MMDERIWLDKQEAAKYREPDRVLNTATGEWHTMPRWTDMSCRPSPRYITVYDGDPWPDECMGPDDDYTEYEGPRARVVYD